MISPFPCSAFPGCNVKNIAVGWYPNGNILGEYLVNLSLSGVLISDTFSSERLRCLHQQVRQAVILNAPCGFVQKNMSVSLK
jgi:hypothetical protein